jgi:hypothetical protein
MKSMEDISNNWSLNSDGYKEMKEGSENAKKFIISKY